MAAQPPFESRSDEGFRRWHRLFGLLLSDQFTNSPFTVVLEMDLSQKQQFLDVLVVRRQPGRVKRVLPDGLDDLAAHNLITFKSYREPLNDWALKEPTGHYVNYRKQVSPRGRLLSEDQFRLIAVCARQPRDLFAALPPERLRPGVYTCQRGSDAIRLVVAAELPHEERNALLHLFSAAPEKVQYGAEHYRVHSPDMTTTVNRLFAEYRVEGLPMPYTMADFRKEVAPEILAEMTPEERLAGLPVEEILKRISTREILARIPAEELLAALPREQIEAFLARQSKKPATAAKKKRKRGG